MNSQEKFKVKILKEKYLKQIINELKGLDLKTVSTIDILEILKPIGHILVQGIKFEAGRSVFRNRSDKYGQYYTKAKDISYKKTPDKNGRASTGSVIFYGAVPTKDLSYGPIISIVESSELLKTKGGDQLQKETNTVGIWEVKKDIDLVAVVNHPNFSLSNSEAKNINDSFLKNVSKLPEIKNELLLFSEFISSEYAKKVEKGNEHEYKISAAFTELITSLGFGGIMYPSFQTEYKGFNVALTKDVVDNCLELTTVGTHELTLCEDQVYIDVSMVSNKIENGNIQYIDSNQGRIGNFLLKKIIN